MITFYHAPWSRGSSVLWLLEELGEPYRIETVDIRAGGGAPEAYRSIQPNKKVPAIRDGEIVVTERAAIAIYLADRYPNAGLAPAIDQPARSAYLTWLVYCDAVFDPAIAARAHGLTYESNDYSFGLFDDLLANLERHLSRNAFAAGERFTAADTQLASGIGYAINHLKVLPDRPVFTDYIGRIETRPAYLSAMKKDAELAAATPYFQDMMAQKSD